MYKVVMLRDRRSLRRGFYIKKFDSLEKLANYIMSGPNYGRCYRLGGLTRKEQWILNTKCFSLLQSEDSKLGS